MYGICLVHGHGLCPFAWQDGQSGASTKSACYHDYHGSVHLLSFCDVEADARWSSYFVRESWGGMIKQMVGVADESRRLPCLPWRPVGVVFRRFMCDLYGADPTMYAAWSTALLMSPPSSQAAIRQPAPTPPTPGSIPKRVVRRTTPGVCEDRGAARSPRCSSRCLPGVVPIVIANVGRA